MNDVGSLTDAAREEFGLFKDRCPDLVESIPAEGLAGNRFDPLPRWRLVREDVPCASNSLDHKAHDSSTLRLPAAGTGNSM
jgi:hypothetical protein